MLRRSPRSAVKSGSAKRKIITGLVGVGALLGATFLTAAPANAAGSCSSLAYDQGTGVVTGSCAGTVYIGVTCYAIWPYSPWNDVNWYNFGGGQSFWITDFANCPWPAGYDVYWLSA
ncbi:MAG: hypothetical protein WBA87_10025 [Microbacterium sp.]